MLAFEKELVVSISLKNLCHFRKLKKYTRFERFNQNLNKYILGENKIR